MSHSSDLSMYTGLLSQLSLGAPRENATAGTTTTSSTTTSSPNPSTTPQPDSQAAYIASKRAEEYAMAYIKNCRRFEVPIDPNVVITLLTQWDTLSPTRQHFSEGAMLPLMGVLDTNEHIRTLNLSSAGMCNPTFRAGGNGNSNAKVTLALTLTLTRTRTLTLTQT